MNRIIIIGLLLGLFFQCQSQNRAFETKNIIGEWEYESHISRNVGRYGPEEVKSLKYSVLCIMKDKIYFKDILFIDTCFYSELHRRAFFDRKEKMPSYIIDGPLAVKYSREQLNEIEVIDLNCKYNCLGSLYFKHDTLILNSCGGITLFLTKIPSEYKNK